jgi:hypothetical protein
LHGLVLEHCVKLGGCGLAIDLRLALSEVGHIRALNQQNAPLGPWSHFPSVAVLWHRALFPFDWLFGNVSCFAMEYVLLPNCRGYDDLFAEGVHQCGNRSPAGAVSRNDHFQIEIT